MFGPEVRTLFSCSTQLSMNFLLLLKYKIQIIKLYEQNKTDNHMRNCNGTTALGRSAMIQTIWGLNSAVYDIHSSSDNLTGPKIAQDGEDNRENNWENIKFIYLIL